ncbi:hypothetical protein KKF91_18695 [Myxococcota bacterium]|nr:hypothetical protein [Myxococcota bacterium]
MAAAAPPSMRPPAWTGRSRGSAWGHRFLFAWLRRFGLEATYLFIDLFILPYYLLFAPSARRASIQWMEAVHGPASAPQRLRWIWRHLRAFAHSLVDQMMVIAGRADAFTLEHPGAETLRGAYAEGRGLLLLSGHVGARAVAGELLRGIKLNLAVFENEALAIRRAWAAGRADQPAPRVLGISADPLSGLKLLRALKAGEAVAILADRALGDTLEIPFMGRPCRFPRGPFLLALLARAPVVCAFSARRGRRSLIFEAKRAPEVSYLPEDKEESMRSLARWYVAELEDFARAHPEQWFNLYDFWA